MTIHVYVDKFLWTFPIVSFFLHFLQLIQNPIIIFISMVLASNSPTSPRTWMGTIKKGEVKVPNKVRKRPTKLVIPEICSCVDLGVVVNEPRKMEFEVQGRYFFLACRRGRREVMEDDYGVITDINGDPKQAFFGVFDGHGGREAVDYVAENLGKNIVKALRETAEIEDGSERAIREGYLTTDKEFLNKGVCSGACVATALFKDGKLYVANVGDCRVIACRNGVATSLTNDHHLSRDDERYRVESTGGYVNCRNGIWRVQGSLAVSRAIGDSYLKEWIVSEPEINKLQLTTEYEFLVIASDGLWDKVTNQEAVDVVSRHKKSVEACKRLVDISCSRGNKDDITVMVVDLHNFRMHG